MLDKRLVQIPFAGGIDTKTDPKQVQPGKLLDFQNGIFLQSGAVNFRWGYKALGSNILGTSQNIASAFAIEAFNEELLLYDGLKAYSYIPANDAWAQRGSVVSVIQTNAQVIANSSQQLSPDFGTLNGIEVYAWEDSRGGIRYSVRDAATGAFVLVDQPLFVGMPSTIVRPKVIPASANNAIAVFFVTTAGQLGYVAIPTNSPTSIGTPVYLFSDLETGTVVDAPTYDALAAGGNIYIAYINVITNGSLDGVRIVRLLNLQTTFWNSQIVTFGVAGSTPPWRLAISIPPSLSGVWLMWANSTNMNLCSAAAIVVSTTGGTTIATARTMMNNIPGTARMCAVVATPVNGVDTGFCYLEVQQPAPNNISIDQLIYKNSLDINDNVGFLAVSPPVYARSVGLASKPFQYNGAVYVNVAYQSNLQSTYLTLDATGNVVAKIFPGLCGGLIQNSDSILPECPAITPGVFKYANLIKGISNTQAGTVFSLLGVNATQLDFAHSNNFLSAALNNGLYTVGGVLQHYDGAQYTELNFHLYPEQPTAVPSASGGFIAGGIYNYCVTYEWNDNVDAVDISTPSVALSVTVPAGTTGSVQLTIATLRLTKKSRVKIVVYRTQASGQLLYRVSSALTPLYNDPTVDTLTFTDTLSDSSIIGNGLMYTQPLLTTSNPILPNAGPPSCSLICTYANRLVIAGLDDPNTIAYSQTAIAGAPAQFPATLILRSDPDGGPITALARMDDKVIVFKSNAILYFFGQGPTATGDNNDFQTLINIPSGAVGCTSANAIVLTPMGLLFQSRNGIYLLDRSLNVTYKGAPVEKYTSPNGLNLTITSATLVPNQWVVFTTSSGFALVYDYFFDQWSTFTNHAAVDSTLYLGNGDLFTWVNGSGQVFLQTPTTFTDAGVPINFSLTTAKIPLAGIQGYQRIYEAFLLGQYKGTHVLTVGCAFDYDDTFTAFATVPSDQTLGITTFGSASPFGIDSPFGGSPGQTVYQFRFDIVRKCQSIQFQIASSETAPGQEGFSLSQIALRVGVKRGGYKGIQTGKQFGVT